MSRTEAYHPASANFRGGISSGEDPRVLQAVEEYLAALEAGRAPSRDEFLSRHAAIAMRLAEYLDGLELIHRAGSAAGPGVDGEAALDDLAGAEPLGDFLLVREIGRGGMGVVYEALQRSLNRRVALKVLPFAAALDSKQLQRFKNEAQAAACLHHTHIVPVFGVGCERGVHYYAMQYIDGRTLASVLAELRQEAGLDPAPPPQPLSEVTNELLSGRLAPVKRTPSPGPPTTPCVLPTPAVAPAGTPTRTGLSTERSIKRAAYIRTMASLALQAAEALAHAHEEGVVHRDIKPANLLVDVKGKLWITDFGLARCQSQADLTMTGDLVGTLRYMSPEQALAKRVLIDHRTDIYSLAVTLYELLTLEAPFAGQDREELLRQIAFDEPQPPRRRNKSIPVELETIVLKAMDKNPAERYATAQDLADDLRRFLEDKPIRAKRPTLVQRAAKWARRHRSAMRAAIAVLLLAVVGLAMGTWMIWQEKEQTQAALADAKANAERAQRHLDTGYRILDEIYVDTAEKRLPREKELTAKDRQFLERALRFYEEFANQESSDPRVRQKTVEAYLRVGAIQERLGLAAKAAKAYQDALTVATQLVGEFPDDPDCRQQLARSYSSLGGMIGNLLPPKRYPEVDHAYTEALRLQEHLVREFPANLEYWRDLGLTYFRLGGRIAYTSGYAEGEAPIRRAVDIRERLVEEKPAVFIYRQELGMSLGNLGNILAETGRYEEAQEVYQRNLRLRQKLVEDFPAESEALH